MIGSFAQDLKDLRIRKGWTQAFMAFRLGVPLRTYESWEGGKRTPPPWAQKMILKETGCSPIAMVSGLIDRAAGFAVIAHADQRDKAGAPYILHPFRVAMRMNTDIEIATALLHDTIEDSDVWPAMVLDLLDFPVAVKDAVKVLTHDKSEPYMDYIAKVAKNPLAAKVKMADLLDNMDLTRLKQITAADVERCEKYRKAFAFLADSEK